MKDLDFDELDRAVNSLLPNSSASAEEQTTPSLADDTATPVDDDAPTQPVSQPLATRRSSGRFMDVVHPSSDMRTTTVPARPVSREGAVIIPSVSRAPLDAPLSPSQNTTWSPADSSPRTSEAPKQASGEWPDPIDFTGASADEASNITTEPKVEDLSQPSQEQSWDDDKDINQIADDISKTLGQDQEPQTPLESPFLTDAKVEKRPLGAFSSEVAVPTDSLQDADATPSVSTEPEILAPVDKDDTKTDDQPIEIDTPLPAELQDDLLLIEAGLDTKGQPKKDEPIVPQKPPVEVPVGPTSITQQYKEQPSTGDQPTGAIFDTGAYQKPLAHPAKKKPGWLLVFWVALLLVAGAGAGAVVYFYVLPLL